MTPEEQDRERELFRFLMENIPDRIYFKDRESRFVAVNAAMARLFKLAGPEEAVGKSDFDFFPEEDARRMFADEQRVLETGEGIAGKVEKKLLPDGSVGWTLTTKLPLRSPDGEIVGTCGMSRDITAVKAAELALEQERNRLKGANADLARSQALLERKLGELERINGELKAAQKRLIDAEKAQSIGRLALGVAHEVRNPLAILKMGVDFFSSQQSSDESGALVLQEMGDAVRRADAIIDELMVFANSTDLTLSPVQVSAVIDAALAPFEEEIAAEDIQVVRQYGSGLPMGRLDVEKMQHVFSNLIENAVDAMRGGGTLTIRIGLTHLLGPDMVRDPGNRTMVHSGIRKIGIVVEFDDTGCGIPEEKLANIFDPFFTTKATGKGTGLGLTVSRKVVELHGGTLDITNRPEGGVCAKVLIKV
ncbi:MAG: ATP-binding protein [Chthoniobacteraceae bacterium]